MAQVFKSRDLTFSIPEKEPDQLATVVTCGVTNTVVRTLTYNHPCICTHHTPDLTWYNWTTWTVLSPYVNVCPGFTLLIPTAPSPTCSDPVIAVDNITDIETLKVLRVNLNASLNDVEGRLAELSKTKK